MLSAVRGIPMLATIAGRAREPVRRQSQQILTCMGARQMRGGRLAMEPGGLMQRAGRANFSMGVYGPQPTGSRWGWNWNSILWRGFVGGMALTGVVVWAVELGDQALDWLDPVDYNEQLAKNIDEERRRDAFFDINVSLPDDLYFAELDAKNIALTELTDKLTKSFLLEELGGPVSRQGARRQLLSFLCISNRSPLLWAAEARQWESLYDVEQQQSSRHVGRSWVARFYIEGGSGLALGLARFEQNSHGQWICVGCSVWKLARSGEHMLHVESPLPHGIKYMNLNLRNSSNVKAREVQSPEAKKE